MVDWSKSMKQSFEYYIVNPDTWKDEKPLTNVKSSSIDRDLEADTLGSASIEADGYLGEAYVRVYLITIQNGMREKHPLGTFLVQTPSSDFDGKIRSVSMAAYTPLLELNENPPPIGYFLLKGTNVMDNAYMIMREHMRAPVVRVDCQDTLYRDFVTNGEEKWLPFVKDLIANAKYEFMLDELGRVLFAPKQNIDSLQPKWTYTDDNSSILYPNVNMDHDYYKVPNVVEVRYSNGKDYYYAKVVNDDPNSPASTVQRGRPITHRIDNPNMVGTPTQAQIEKYAKMVLREMSTIKRRVTYTHGYAPVQIGDCVRLNYKDAGLNGVKARVIRQSIKCKLGCEVSETAEYTYKLWGD